jgi:hypothetical protein
VLLCRYNSDVVRTAVGVLFLAFQLAAIVYARRSPSRYFCWAPYDTQTDFTIRAALHGRPLTPAEIRQRYRRPARGSDNRSPQHVIDMIEGVERRLPPDRQADVLLTYRVNGRPERSWQWTPH